VGSTIDLPLVDLDAPELREPDGGVLLCKVQRAPLAGLRGGAGA